MTKLSLFPKQKEFVTAFKTREFWYMLYGGAVSGGKSMLLIGLLDQLCMIYPDTRYAVVRKNRSTLKRTSWQTYKSKILPMTGKTDIVETNNSDLIGFYPNGSQLEFVEADHTKDPDFIKLGGLELTGALMEECNECVEKAFSIIKIRVGRWNNKKYDIPPFVLANCNPDNNWVKDTFYDPSINGTMAKRHYFLQALPKDNPYNTPEYLEALDSLPEAERARYRDGNWEYSNDPNQLIQYSWYKNALTESIELKNTNGRYKKIFLGVDVARYGDDLTVLAYMTEEGSFRFEKHKHISVQEIADIVEQRIKEYSIAPKQIMIDTVGIGAGVYDILRSKGHAVNEFVAGEKAQSKARFFKFKNKRAEAAWLVREDLENERMVIVHNKELSREITQIRYIVDDKMIQLESKDAMKKRLGNSPDYFDALMMANYAKTYLPSGVIIKAGKRAVTIDF